MTVRTYRCRLQTLTNTLYIAACSVLARIWPLIRMYTAQFTSVGHLQLAPAGTLCSRLSLTRSRSVMPLASSAHTCKSCKYWRHSALMKQPDLHVLAKK